MSMTQTKHASESQRLKIYVENVHHSREHMHSNDYTMHCAIAAAMMVETDRKWFLSYGRNRKVAESMQTAFGRNPNKAES